MNQKKKKKKDKKKNKKKLKQLKKHLMFLFSTNAPYQTVSYFFSISPTITNLTTTLRKLESEFHLVAHFNNYKESKLKLELRQNEVNMV